MKIEKPLLGKRIAIRNYTPEDLAFCADMWFDQENGRYLSDPDREHWRRGYGTELVELLAGRVRDQGGTAITGEAAKENRASCALLEKCGFEAVCESGFKKYRMDIHFDSLIYQKTLM